MMENQGVSLSQVSMHDLDDLASTAADVLAQVRDAMVEPHPRKVAPTFSSAAIADLCGVDKTQVKYLAQKHNLPNGQKIEGSKAKEYSLEDAIAWVMTIGKRPSRPEDKSGKVISVCNYKGGVAKTSTTVAIAQALTLRGLKVLVIDCDGQGTATQLIGISPEQDVEIEQTIMPYIHGDEPDLRYAVQSSYWHNLSVIPASSGLLAAEFAIPAKAMSQRGFRFWEMLKTGIAPLRKDFDLILIDTSPSLSHLTVNAMIAADGLLMPCPPDALDFASSVQFWGIFSELVDGLPDAKEKRYDFISIIYTKVQANEISRLVKTWMKQAYGTHINGIEIPDSTAARTASAQLKTIYDLSKPDGSAEAYRRYKDPLDRLADYVLDQLALGWRQ
ncbi:ParA family protein [Noviherbaspirillum saxi]|uniref:Cobyrinic acid a,c-diamide synthase n=1 Tax=Noviherbaspirillum saxi TaxID=2320863 RepID=A0A3A3FKR2_9BURK|nr:ParA family protein [Noviherbaspirillum saxi]RJF92092.1 cobyrinic acid a,c-diamide synthase [Noviherbaspirillum saxi]